MRLIFLIDNCRCSLETLPDLLTELFCNGSILLPLLMKRLKFAERSYNILAFSKFLCLRTQLLLCLDILLEIKIPEFTIYLEHIIKLLDIEMICLVNVAIILRRNLAYSSPSVLDIAELLKCAGNIFLLLQQCLKIGYHRLLQCKVCESFLF